MNFKPLTIKDLNLARKTFEENEPRDLFYRAATELVNLAVKEEIKLTLGEALSVLLQTWNKAYYQYNPFNKQHFDDIENLLEKYMKYIEPFRWRYIESLCDNDIVIIKEIFTKFEVVLGPVGAAKALHLLAPNYFPLWDRDIAKDGYGIYLKKRGRNADLYVSFMEVVRRQYRSLKQAGADDANLVKAIDEYNYCRYTKDWIKK